MQAARMNIPNKCLKAYYSRDLITRATTTSSQIAPPLSHYLKILDIASNAVKREIEAHNSLCKLLCKGEMVSIYLLDLSKV